MLELKNIRKVFNAGTVNERIALDGINLTLNDGDFVTVIGSNGAGKSTMLNAIAGVFPVDGGSIICNGKDVTHLAEYKRAAIFGRVFQDPMMGTSPAMLIEENLALALRRGQHRGLKWGISEAERNRFKKALSSFDLGLENRLSTKVRLLSGGQRQALTLLMAVIKKPDVLLLDEHTAALDPKTASKVLCMTDSVIRQNNLTTLMITHNMKDALEYGNRLIMMDAGKIIFDASGDDKKKLTVNDLMGFFSDANDSMILAK